MSADQEPPASCAECGRDMPVEGGDGVAISLDVWTADDDDYRYASFCSQQHASDWLAKPLPPIARPPAVDEPLSDKLMAAGCVGGLVGVVGLAGYGLVTLVRLLF